MPAARPTTAAATTRSRRTAAAARARSRRAPPSDEARRDPARRVGPAEQRAAGDAREEAEQERERAGDRGRALRVPVVLEQRHDPVADDHAEAERHRVDRGEPVQPPVAEEAAAEPLAGVADASAPPAGARASSAAQTAHDDDRADVGRAPAEVGSRAAARPRRRCPARARSRRRRCPGGTASRRARGCSRCRRRMRSPCRCRRSHGRGTRAPAREPAARPRCRARRAPSADERARARAPAVGRAAAGDLHEHVHDELHRHEQPDGGEADVVGVRELRRDRPEQRDVPAHRDADADARDAVHRATQAAMQPGCSSVRCARARRPGSRGRSSSGTRRSAARSRSSCVHSRSRSSPSASRARARNVSPLIWTPTSGVFERLRYQPGCSGAPPFDATITGLSPSSPKISGVVDSLPLVAARRRQQQDRRALAPDVALLAVGLLSSGGRAPRRRDCSCRVPFQRL